MSRNKLHAFYSHEEALDVLLTEYLNNVLGRIGKVHLKWLVLFHRPDFEVKFSNLQ